MSSDFVKKLVWNTMTESLNELGQTPESVMEDQAKWDETLSGWVQNNPGAAVELIRELVLISNQSSQGVSDWMKKQTDGKSGIVIDLAAHGLNRIIMKCLKKYQEENAS